MSSRQHSKPIIMVSSSVYQVKPLLTQIYAVLEGLGYTVWMSAMGTMPVDSQMSAFDNCLDAVKRCDLFLGLITPFYGSGRDKGEPSITHQEMLLAIQQNKRRWFLAHDHVVFARQLLKQYRFDPKDQPREEFEFRRTAVMDDIGVIEMYEAAIRSDRSDLPVSQRTGNWVQEYVTDADIFRFLNSQFGDFQTISKQLKERNAS